MSTSVALTDAMTLTPTQIIGLLSIRDDHNYRTANKMRTLVRNLSTNGPQLSGSD